MENALLYEFSTIAQALAGAIGLLGAVVLYKLQRLDASIEADSLVAMRPLDSNYLWLTTYDFHLSEFEKELDKYMLEHRGEGLPYNREEFRSVIRLRGNTRQRRLIKRRFWWAMGVTAVGILGSLVALRYDAELRVDQVAARYALNAGLIVSALCLMSYFHLLKVTLRNW